MIQDIWFNYLFFFVIVFMVLYAIWWAMGQETNKKTEPNKVIDFLDKHLLSVGNVLIFTALIVFVFSLIIGEIHITINTFDTGEFLYFQDYYYNLDSMIFNIAFGIPLVAGFYCFYGYLNRNGRAPKKILKGLWISKFVIVSAIVFVFEVLRTNTGLRISIFKGQYYNFMKHILEDVSGVTTLSDLTGIPLMLVGIFFVFVVILTLLYIDKKFNHK